MAVLDRLRSPEDTGKLPGEVEDRLNRGAERLRQLAPKRNEAWEFFRGNHYAYLDEKNVLRFQPTGTSITGGGKPAHRERKSYNLIMDAVAHEVSAATQRVPSYEIAPSTGDQEDSSAAKMAERVALAGYDQWSLRAATVKAVTSALVADESFAMPYFDNSIGPYIVDEEGRHVGQGDIRLRVYSGNQVGWEPGTRFEDSPWHYIEYGQTAEQVMATEGYLGGKLKPDSDSEHQAHKGQESASQTKLVLVREYLEQPSAKRPLGRWIVVANGRRIVRDRNYPCAEYEGLEGPALHKLTYIVDPDSDHDMGLVRHLLDAQRVHNFAWNKAAEWVKVALAPQMVVTPGLLQRQRITDEPGAVYEIPQPDQNMKWREVPAIPRELFELADRTESTIGRIAAQNDVPSQVEAGRAIQALIERDASRRQAFIHQLAEWHSSVMRHCLALCAAHYTEDRLLKYKGRFGWDSVDAFQGAQLRSQIDVRVMPGSIEPRTKAALEQKILAYADRQWISPQAAMHAMDSGTAEKLIEDVNLAVARAHRIIKKVIAGPEVLFSMPPRVGQQGEEVPGWMPQHWDNIPVHKSVFESWFQTEESETLPLPMQEAANQYYQALLQLEYQKQAEQLAAQQAQAADLGMQNAAKPQDKGTPDQRAVGDAPPGQGPPTQNQPADQSAPTSQ